MLVYNECKNVVHIDLYITQEFIMRDLYLVKQIQHVDVV